ncbi:MAG: GerMN domain-containing protein [bacterium]|nr:GerMN domain-containing protein [bacterium]
MLKKMYMRKILITSLTLFVFALLCLMPSKKDNTIDTIDSEVTYVYENNLAVVYLLDKNNYVARTKISSLSDDDIIAKVRDLVETLIIDGKKNEIIPNGFRPIIPSGTSIKDISLSDGILKLDFSKEFLDTNIELEEKMIEALTYTLTNIEGIKGIIIYVEGELLNKLPLSKKILPTFLDRNFGINKVYDISSINSIDSITCFYVSSFNDTYYYVPVTKYFNNNNDDKVKIIVEELKTSSSYESNLMSYLNVNTKLLNYEINDNIARLNFNDMIFFDMNDKSILEEVVYTISLSFDSLYDIEEIDFLVNGEEIYKSVVKDIE